MSLWTPPCPTGDVADNTGPQIRLLVCLNCKTIEELPDFTGPSDRDVLLETLVERHQSAGVAHAGHLVKVPEKHWKVPATRQSIVKQIRDGCGGLSETDPDFYDTKATFHEDALACYAQHQRPKGQCPDWRSEQKILRPSTSADRVELGLDPAARPKVYLCQFCPVATYNATKHREAAGLYA